ncbi:PAS domain-containing protein, partial [Stenotrophomonas maltophilia]
MDAAASTTSVLTDPSRQLRLLIDSVRDHALYLLDPEGVVCSWNPGAERIKGYSADEVVGTHFSRFYLANDRDAGEPQRLLRLAAQHGHVASEGWRVRRDGSSFRASVVIEPVVEAGELLGFVKITRDITEQWQAQRLLRDA